MLPIRTLYDSAIFDYAERVINLPVNYLNCMGFICFNRLFLLPAHTFAIENNPHNGLVSTKTPSG